LIKLCKVSVTKVVYYITEILLSKKMVKVTITLVQALRLCTGRTAHRGSKGISLLFQDHGTRRSEGFSVTPRPLFTPGKDTVPNVQEAGWAPGPAWTGAENLASTGIRSPKRLECSQSLLILNRVFRKRKGRHYYGMKYSHT
jgi:hypothetical protein